MKLKWMIFLWLGLMAGFLSAQESLPRLLGDRMISTGIQFSSWKIGDDRMTQVAIPVSFTMPFARDGRVYLSSSPAMTGLSRSTQTDRLDGMTDIQLGGNTFLFNNNWLLTFGLNLPTGKKSLDTEEQIVWKELIQPAFHYPVATYGQGLQGQLGISTAVEVGDMMLGLGLSYLYKGPFQLTSGAVVDYNAGDEIVGTVGIQYNNFTADVMTTYYFPDQWGKQEIFQSGLSFLIQVMGHWTVNAWELTALVRNQIKTKNSLLVGEKLTLERKSYNANQLEVVAMGKRPMENHLSLIATLDFRLYGDNDYGYGGATLTGPGVGLEWPVSHGITLNGLVRMLFGKINTTTGAYQASGLNGNLSLSIQI